MNNLKIKAGKTTNDVEIILDGNKLENITELYIHPLKVNELIKVTFTGYVSEIDIDVIGEFIQAGD